MEMQELQMAYGTIMIVLVIACQTCYRIKVKKGTTPGRNMRHGFFVFLAMAFIALGYSTMPWYVPTMYLVGGAMLSTVKDIFEAA
jgi:hypothetical protein